MDTRLRGDDRDTLGTVTLTAEDLRKILTHGQQGSVVTNDKDIVKSARDTSEGRRNNFIVSQEILRFNRQVLEKEAPEEEPNECIRTLRELVSQ